MVTNKTKELLEVGSMLLKIDKIKLATKPMNCGMEMAKLLTALKQELADEMINIFNDKPTIIEDEELTVDTIQEVKPYSDTEIKDMQIELIKLATTVASLESQLATSKDEVEQFLTNELAKIENSNKTTTARKRKTTSSK